MVLQMVMENTWSKVQCLRAFCGKFWNAYDVLLSWLLVCDCHTSRRCLTLAAVNTRVFVGHGPPALPLSLGLQSSPAPLLCANHKPGKGQSTGAGTQTLRRVREDVCIYINMSAAKEKPSPMSLLV